MTIAVALLTVLALAGCTGRTAPSDRVGKSSAPQVLNPYTTGELLSVITQAGLPAPHPHTVTAQECPAIGCTEKLDTDTVAIIKFPTSGRAELYAGSVQRYFQIEDVVLIFAPSVPASEKLRYETAVKRAIE